MGSNPQTDRIVVPSTHFFYRSLLNLLVLLHKLCTDIRNMFTNYRRQIPLVISLRFPAVHVENVSERSWTCINKSSIPYSFITQTSSSRYCYYKRNPSKKYLTMRSRKQSHLWYSGRPCHHLRNRRKKACLHSLLSIG